MVRFVAALTLSNGAYSNSIYKLYPDRESGKNYENNI